MEQFYINKGLPSNPCLCEIMKRYIKKMEDDWDVSQ